MKDYYYIMGLKKGASKDDIKKAYRKLSVKFHPDKNDGDPFFEERFKEINEAYEILGNDENRKLYDLSIALSNIDIDKLYDTTENSYENEKQIHLKESISTKSDEVKKTVSFLHYWGVVCVVAYVIAALNAFIFNWWDMGISAGIAFGAGLFGWYADTKIKKSEKSKTELSR